MDGYERRKEWSKVKRPWEGKVEIRGRKEGKRERGKKGKSLRASEREQVSTTYLLVVALLLTLSTPQGR